jgi:acyl phosphate:glycerol-3-phosphate acyltransferase
LKFLHEILSPRGVILRVRAKFRDTRIIYDADMIINGTVIVLFAYLFGSIPTGVVLSRYWGKIDIREVGSGNIGATNVYRTLGKSLGALTLFGDILKGLIPVLIAIWLLKSEFWISLTILSAFVGHIYSIFLKFQGGKGVATAMGVFLPIIPWAVFIAALVFAGTLYKWRYVALGSIVAAGSVPISTAVLPYSKVYLITSLIIAALIIYRHQENIKRLRKGEEPTIGKRRS